MPTNIQGDANNGYNVIVAPSDGDPRNAASAQVPLQSLADRTEVLRLRDIITRHGSLVWSGAAYDTAYEIKDLVVDGDFDTTIGAMLAGNTVVGAATSTFVGGSGVENFTDGTDINVGCLAFNDVASMVCGAFDSTAGNPIIERFSAGAWLRALDGSTTPNTTGTGSSVPRRARYANGIFAVICGDTVFHGNGGIAATWTKTEVEAGIQLSDIQYNETRDEWVVTTNPAGSGFNSGVLVSTDNCATWTRVVADGAGVPGDGIGMSADGIDWGRDSHGEEVLCYVGNYVDGSYAGGLVRAFTRLPPTVLDPLLAPTSVDMVLAGATGGAGASGHVMYCRGLWYVGANKSGPWPIYGHLVERVMVRAKVRPEHSGSGYEAGRWAKSEFGDYVFLAVHDNDNEGHVYNFPKCAVFELDDTEAYP